MEKRHPRTRVLATITKLGKPLIDKIAILLKSPNPRFPVFLPKKEKLEERVVIQNLHSFFRSAFTYEGIVFLWFFMKKMKVMHVLSCIPLRSRKMPLLVILNRILSPSKYIRCF